MIFLIYDFIYLGPAEVFGEDELLADVNFA